MIAPKWLGLLGSILTAGEKHGPPLVRTAGDTFVGAGVALVARNSGGDRRGGGAALPLESARLRSGDHEFRRRQYFGEGRRVRSADGNRNARVVGEGLGRRSRQHGSRWLRHTLSRQAACARGPLPGPGL